MKPKTIIFFILLSLLFSACGNQPTPTPEIIPTLTAAPQPTATSIPSPLQANWCSPEGMLKNDFSVIGYFPDYRDFNTEWGKVVTDFIYFSAEPSINGDLDTSRLQADALQGMQEMKSLYGTHLFISIGGYERSEHFGTVVTNPALREQFATQIIRFAEENQLDGIDFDWEFPKTDAEIEGYIEMLKAIQASGLIVSAALAPYEGIDLTPYAIVDRIHIMSYDHEGQHSTYQQSLADVALFLDAGVPERKLYLGIPFYGRRTTNFDEEFAYAEIITAYAPSADVDEIEEIYFNGIQSVQDKTRYAYENELGGIMIWELGQDTPDETSLLRAIAESLQQSCP